jgi:MFS family permease
MRLGGTKSNEFLRATGIGIIPFMEEKRIFGFTHNVFFLGLVSFFNDFSGEMVQSVMPVFITSVLGAPAFFLGLIEGVADALSSILKLFSGWFSDKIGRRKLPAIVGYVLSVGTRPVLALVLNFWQVFGLRVVDRIGKGFRDSPRDALLAESVPRGELGKSFGFHRSMDTMGAILGPLLAFFLLPAFHNSYRTLFLVAFVIGIGALFSFAFVHEKKKDVTTPAAQKPKLDLAVFRANRKFVFVVLSIFVFGMGTLPILLVLLKAKEVGLPGGDLPLVYFVYSLTFVLTAIPLGRLADRIGERFVIGGGFCAAAVAYFGLANTLHPVATLFFFVVLGIYSAATDGLMRVLAAKHVAPDILATGQGFLNMAIGCSSLLAGIVGGLLWTRAGSQAALFYAGIVSVVGLVLFVMMTRTPSKNNQHA